MMFAKKKDGTLRLCINYMHLNKVKINNRHHFVRIDDLFDHLKGEEVFSKIDLWSRYHQVCIEEEDIYDITFWTWYGHYQFVAVPFGLNNAPTTCMCLMNSVLLTYLVKFFIVFIYDILIYSKNEEEHVKNIASILRFMREN